MVCVIAWLTLAQGVALLTPARAANGMPALKSPNNADYSTIYETSGTTSTQTVNVTVSGGLSTGTVHVWSTDMGSANNADYFVRQADITPSNGAYTLTMQPNRIYTVTTTTGQGKGTATSPATSGLALPYADNFDGYANRGLARYFQDMQGSYETRACAAGSKVRPSKGIVRTLAATAKGAFRAVGGAATITASDGTWIVSDRCDGTMTEVGRGRVVVRDTKLDRDFTLRSGQGYLARAKLFAAKKNRDG